MAVALVAGAKTGAFWDATDSAAANLKGMPSIQQQRNNNRKATRWNRSVTQSEECLSVMFVINTVTLLSSDLRFYKPMLL
jgi:hypothetical protein